MKKIIAVAGGTGNLGGRIVRALLDLDVDVRMIVRPGTDPARLAKFKEAGVEIFEVDIHNIEELKKC